MAEGIKNVEIQTEKNDSYNQILEVFLEITMVFILYYLKVQNWAQWLKLQEEDLNQYIKKTLLIISSPLKMK